LGNRADITIYDGDVNGVNYLLCGSVKSTTFYTDGSKNSAVVQILNKNVMLDYQLVFEGIYNAYMSHCQFGNAGSIFFGINAQVTSAASNYEKIVMYKYIMANAQYSVGKMF
jgi:hypothetical protein